MPTPGRSATTPMPKRCESDAGPTPESWSSCGELNEPPATSTSTRAVAEAGMPSRRYSTPVARLPENRMRVACARVTTARLARRRAGRR